MKPAGTAICLHRIDMTPTVQWRTLRGSGSDPSRPRL